MNLHWLNPELAKKYGLESALIFQSIGYWVNHNRNKPDRQKHGKPWFYMSREDWMSEFPYIGVGSLRSAIDKLKGGGLIECGNFSDGVYKRTTWYTLTDLGWELWLIQPNPLANSAKPFGENSQTITDNTQQTITDLTTPSMSPSTKEKKNATRGQRLEQYLDETSIVTVAGWVEWAIGELGWDRERANTVYMRFKEYWSSPDAKSPVKRDWPMAWRNWCRRENDKRGPSRQACGDSKPSRYDAIRNAAMAVRVGGEGLDGREPPEWVKG